MYKFLRKNFCEQHGKFRQNNRKNPILIWQSMTRTIQLIQNKLRSSLFIKDERMKSYPDLKY